MNPDDIFTVIWAVWIAIAVVVWFYGAIHVPEFVIPTTIIAVVVFLLIR